MRTPPKTIAAIAFGACLIALAAPRTHAPGPRGAFYYWQTVWTSAAADSWRGAGFDRLYLRFFDVAPDQASGEAVPVAPVEFAVPVPGAGVVPVVFIANEALRGARPDQLAGKILAKVATIAQSAGIKVAELQVDCDWTDSTRAAYFALLAAMRAKTSIALSATIRLHQIKYRERTGIPPVDRGMLMFYNMGAIGAAASSIFNAEDAAKYAARIDAYPLPLDVALPLFSWAIQERAGHVVGLLEGLAEDDAAGSPLLATTAPGVLTAKSGGFFRGRYLVAGDALRFETMTPATTRAAAALAAAHEPRQAAFGTVAFFDLNPRNLARYEPSFFRETLAAFD